jgi:hypothetical protein
LGSPLLRSFVRCSGYTREKIYRVRPNWTPLWMSGHLPTPPRRDELLDLYKIAVEEYRFQVKLNADRSRDYVVVNSAIIASGIALLGQAHLPFLAGLVFVIGLGVAVLAIMGTSTQHGYYRDARDTQRQLAGRLGFSDLTLIKVKPTGNRYRRFGSVTRLNYVILSLLCFVDIMGALSGFGVIPRPKAPSTVTNARPTAKPVVSRISPALTPAPQRSSSGQVRPAHATPRHP